MIHLLLLALLQDRDVLGVDAQKAAGKDVPFFLILFFVEVLLLRIERAGTGAGGLNGLIAFLFGSFVYLGIQGLTLGILAGVHFHRGNASLGRAFAVALTLVLGIGGGGCFVAGRPF
jgi:hypothetical protein